MGEAHLTELDTEESLPLLDSTAAKNQNRKEETLYGILIRLLNAVSSPDPEGSVFRRIKISVCENLPLIPDASRNTARNLLHWTRRGTVLRALLVISVGTIVLLALTGLLVFMLFFIAATVNAIIISLLMSLAAAGGFLAIFLACTTAIYIGLLSVAIFVISSATITTIAAVLLAAGWLGFFCAVWIVTKKSMHLAKHSISMAGSAISACSMTPDELTTRMLKTESY